MMNKKELIRQINIYINSCKQVLFDKQKELSIESSKRANDIGIPYITGWINALELVVQMISINAFDDTLIDKFIKIIQKLKSS